MQLVRETRRVEGDQIIIDRTFKLEKPIEFIKFNFVTCPTEDDHEFNSMGQCSKCGSHRKPR